MKIRTSITLAVVAAASCLIAGVGVAAQTGDPEWIKRSGAAIVCVEGIIAIAEGQMRTRLRKVEKLLPKNPFLEEEIEKAESKVLAVTISIAIFGEMIHGFGDLVYELLEHLIKHNTQV